MGSAMSLTGDRLYPQISPQIEVEDYLGRDLPVDTKVPKLFVIGPPGSGKSVVLLQKAAEWLLDGNNVYVVSSWWGSRAACTMLYLLLQHVRDHQPATAAAPGQLHLRCYDFQKLTGVPMFVKDVSGEANGIKKTVKDLLEEETDIKKALRDLSHEAKGGPLYVIADEVHGSRFARFCNKLLDVCKDDEGGGPRLHLWAAGCDCSGAPDSWPRARPLAVPREPVVTSQASPCLNHSVTSQASPCLSHSVTSQASPCLSHSVPSENCVDCGLNVAVFLENLHYTGNLEWRDMLVLYASFLHQEIGFMKGLSQAGIPARVMGDDDDQIEDIVNARSDVVWVAKGDRVRGLKRKVVLYVEFGRFHWVSESIRVHFLSRYTSQCVRFLPRP